MKQRLKKMKQKVSFWKIFLKKINKTLAKLTKIKEEEKRPKLIKLEIKLAEWLKWYSTCQASMRP
jgi:hypothetical protein